MFIIKLFYWLSMLILRFCKSGYLKVMLFILLLLGVNIFGMFKFVFDSDILLI